MSTTGGRGVLEKVAVALDTNDRATFERCCAFFGPRVGVLKVGLEAFVRWGPPAIEVARRHSRGLVLDLKLSPSIEGMTVTRACASGLQAITLAAAAIERIGGLPLWEGDRHFLPLVFDADPRPFHGVMPYRDGRMVSWNFSR